MNPKTWELIKKNITDTTVIQAIGKSERSQSRKIAIVLAAFMIVSLIAVVFGFVQQTKATAAVETAEKELQVTQTECEKLVGIATEAKIIAEETARLSQEQLEECRKKK